MMSEGFLDYNGSPVVRPWTPTPDEEKAFEASEPTFRWLCHLPTETLHQFAGKWVAAKDCSVIASGDTMNALLDQLGNVDLQAVILHRIRRPAWVIY